jgi:hypothetical protein
MRKNIPIMTEVVDTHDSLFVDGAAKGAHSKPFKSFFCIL